MTGMLKAFAILFTLLASPLALAGGPRASLLVDNNFEGTVDVLIDGYPAGVVGPTSEGVFVVRHGWHDVTVKRRGVVLAHTTGHFRPHRMTEVDVFRPMVSLTVHNTGPTPLKMSGDTRESLWVPAYGSRTVQVQAGRLHMTAQARMHGRLEVVDTQNLFLEPGRRHTAKVRYTPPPPTRLLVRNLEPRDVRIIIDGADHGVLRPHARTFVAVAPGRHVVTAVHTRTGRPMFELKVRAIARGDTAVEVFGPRPTPRPRSHVHVSTNQTPPPPPMAVPVPVPAAPPAAPAPRPRTRPGA